MKGLCPCTDKRRVGRKEQSCEHLAGVPSRCRGGGRRGCHGSCSSRPALLPSASPEASRGTQDGVPGRGGILQLGSALVASLGASQSTGVMGYCKGGGPYQSKELGCTPLMVVLGRAVPSWHRLRMLEETVTWDTDHAVLDMCNYSLLTCNYARNRYLSTGLLCIT